MRSHARGKVHDEKSGKNYGKKDPFFSEIGTRTHGRWPAFCAVAVACALPPFLALGWPWVAAAQKGQDSRSLLSGPLFSTLFSFFLQQKTGFMTHRARQVKEKKELLLPAIYKKRDDRQGHVVERDTR